MLSHLVSDQIFNIIRTLLLTILNPNVIHLQRCAWKERPVNASHYIVSCICHRSDETKASNSK